MPGSLLDFINTKQPNPMKILVKFPTRSRRLKWKETLDKWISLCSNPKDVVFVVSMDWDDPEMNPSLVEPMIEGLDAKIHLYWGISTSKIDAVNRDIEEISEWDILVVASDDMIPQIKGWDDRIREDMLKYWPDGDGVLWYNDGNQGPNLNTLSIMGRAYYARSKYVYHPDYISLYCDVEFTQVSRKLRKVKYSPDVIIRHEHPAFGYGKYDEQYKITESYYRVDRDTFERRKSLGFP